MFGPNHGGYLQPGPGAGEGVGAQKPRDIRREFEQGSDALYSRSHLIARTYERRDPEVRRPVVNVTWLPDLFNAAASHHDEPIRHTERLVLIMRYVDERDSQLSLKLPELDLHILTKLSIKRTQRLIQQKYARPVDDRTCQRHTLLHPSRKLGRSHSCHRLEPNHLQSVLHAATPFDSRNTLCSQPILHVPFDRHVWEQRIALKHRVHITPVWRKISDVSTPDEHASYVWA